MATRCQATNQAGQPCSAQHWRDGWCRWHHPELEAERREWSRRGGANRSNKRRAATALPSAKMTPTELQNFMIVVMTGAVAGRVEKGIANAVANLGRTIAALYPTAEFEQRLADLERREGRAG